MAIYDFLNPIMSSMDKRSPICAIFCDMTQAFDYVHYTILLNKLEGYGIRGNVLELIKTYLENRVQITEVSNINMVTKHEDIIRSRERKISYGVPQGTVMGPFLFITYVNDMPKSLEYPVTMFADDTTVTIPCKSTNTYENDINNSLDALIKWLDENNLNINLGKTKIMHFRQRSPVGTNFNIHYKNDKIEEAGDTKFLGLQIDCNLNWKAHIDSLCKKLSSSAYVLYRLSSIVDVKTLLTAYYGIVESHLRYGIIFWGNSTDRDIAFKAQKRCLRSLFKLKSTDSCAPYFKLHKILTLPCIYIFEVAMFVKQNPSRFERLADVFPRNRRDNSKLCQVSCRTTLMRKSVYCMAPIIYNKLPSGWKALNTAQFKSRLRNFLLDKTYYSVTEFLSEKNIC